MKFKFVCAYNYGAGRKPENVLNANEKRKEERLGAEMSNVRRCQNSLYTRQLCMYFVFLL